MTSHRRKLLPCCIAVALLSGQAGAVGLGEIALQSYLGKPLQAEVQLNDMGDLSSDQIKIAVGSEADYQALGVEYSYLHSQLKIEPFVRNGRGYVRISTRESVSEPYLNFVLNLRWPQGQVVREFTVLLDPAPTAIASAAQPRNAESDVAAVSAESAPRRHRREQSAVPEGGDYVVQRGDSLWRIAEKLRPDNASLQQVMSAIMARNPQAFINGDPARIKEAARIVAPNAEQIAAASDLAVKPAPARDIAAAPAESSAPQADSLTEENAALKTQVASLNDNVASLNQNLVQSEQRLHQLEAQLDGIVQQLQQQRATMAAMSGSSPQTAAASITTGSMINQVNASELKPTPVTRTPWWVHLLYWLGIGGAATWAIREHFWPQRRLELLAAADNSGFVAASSSPEPASRTWQPPAAYARNHIDTIADILVEDASDMDRVAATVSVGEPAPALQRPIDDPVDVSISAGVFLAFGRYDEAGQLLRDALSHAPDRVDLKLQLLDVYMQADKPEMFEALASEIEQGPTTPEIIAELDVLRDGYHSRRH